MDFHTLHEKFEECLAAMDIHFFLQCLSWSAICTTIALFLTGIPMCVSIFRKHSTGDISGIPFLMGFLGGSFWLRYGFLKEDFTMITVNVVGSSLYFLYCLFYLSFADVKKTFGLKFIVVLTTIIGMLFWIQFAPNIDLLGVVCMTFNIINFGAPLAGLGVVLRKRCCDSLPLPMCFFNLLVSSQWFLYGNIVHDRYIMLPNGIGMALAVLQLSLFIIFPRKAQEKSLFQKVKGAVCCLDVEQGKCKPTKSTGTNTVQAGPLFRKPSADCLREKRLSVGFLEGSEEHPQMRSRTNSVPEVFKDKYF